MGIGVQPLGRLPGQQVAEQPVGVDLDQRQVLVAAVDHLRSTSPAVSSPSRRRPTALSAAFSCRSSSSTHWPRTRTSGTLSRASSASSSAVTAPSPITRSIRKSTSWSRPNPESATARDEPVFVRDRVVSFSPTALRPAHVGSCTPKPAACSSGAAWRRNSCASPGVERHRGRLGVAQRVVQQREQPDRPAQPGEQRLVGPLRQAGHPAARPQIRGRGR